MENRAAGAWAGEDLSVFFLSNRATRGAPRPHLLPASPSRLSSPDEVAEAAAIQAAAFYEAAPLSLLDGLLFYAFQGEVLGALQAKMKYSVADGFACLVAEALPPDREWGGAGGDPSVSSPPRPATPGPPAFSGLAGVVEVSLQAEADGMAALAGLGVGDESYAYIACMAVAPAARRAGAATALLAAAERAAGTWRQNWCLLHVHDANGPGVALYEAAGYTPLARESGGWGAGPLAVLARPKPRTLMGRASRIGGGSGGGVGPGGASAATITSISPNLLAMMAAAQAEEEAGQRGGGEEGG